MLQNLGVTNDRQVHIITDCTTNKLTIDIVSYTHLSASYCTVLERSCAISLTTRVVLFNTALPNVCISSAHASFILSFILTPVTGPLVCQRSHCTPNSTVASRDKTKHSIERQTSKALRSQKFRRVSLRNALEPLRFASLNVVHSKIVEDLVLKRRFSKGA